MHPRLCLLVNGSCEPCLRNSNKLYLLSIPMTSSIIDAVVLNLLSSYLTYAIVLASRAAASTRSSIQELSMILNSPSTHFLLDWMPLFSSLPTKQMDPLLTRAYTALNKLCSFPNVSTKPPPKLKSVEEASSNTFSESVFSLRMYALQCLAHTSPGIVEGNTVWDQANRSAALFIKNISSTAIPEAQATSLVLGAFAELVRIAETRQDKETFMAVDEEGKSFIGFCDYWSSFAKRVGTNYIPSIIISFTFCYVGWRYIPSAENQLAHSVSFALRNQVSC